LQDEQPLVAFARALGYQDDSELNSALISRAWEVRRRFFSAREKLFEKFAFDLTTTPTEDSMRKIWETLKRMEAGLRKSYKKSIKDDLGAN
jgi:hypothetical protein